MMIDGIVSGKLLLDLKRDYTIRGSEYVIAKMTSYCYQVGNTKGERLDCKIIAFDKQACETLMNQKKGDIVSVLGMITPIYEQAIGQSVPITLQITAKKLINGYVAHQVHGKGWLFEKMGC